MEQIFDLFGDPVPANWGQRGRPEHVASQRNRNQVSLLVALGWSNKRIASALFVDLKTLRKHYFPELKFRDTARDRLTAGLGLKLMDQVNAGNVAAMKELQKFIERNDLMLYGQAAPQKPAAKEKPEKLGKKQQALLAAQQPDAGTPLGELMARRQQSDLN